MRLFQYLPDTPHNDARVYCYACNRIFALSQTVADLDGPAYAAYYCQPCATELIEETTGA
jgi:hypothetical protein